ncbi:VQ motif-containing protein 10 [Bienertia sinuspersici]
MKVVHIKTQYVETDACSFKSVVQNLTGKDSTIAESPSSSWVMKLEQEINYNNDVVVPQSRLARVSSYADDELRPSSRGQLMLECHDQRNHFNEDYMMGKGGGSYSFLTRNLSYKEMDRMLKELPPLDDLHKILTFDN